MSWTIEGTGYLCRLIAWIALIAALVYALCTGYKMKLDKYFFLGLLAAFLAVAMFWVWVIWWLMNLIIRIFK